MRRNPLPKDKLLSQHSYERQRLLERLQHKGIHNTDVLNAIKSTPRHFFVDEALSAHAYADHPLPIGHGQTISQPFIVAQMTQALWETTTNGPILEIGTGCGYQTAILAHLYEQVYTVERVANLAANAYKRLKFLGFDNIEFLHDDGFAGWPQYAPYKGILVTAAPAELPLQLLQQLALNAAMIIPVGDLHAQQLLKVVRKADHYEQYILENVRFVPLQSGVI
jgi:protein-L-isoaspartate(D-aspartate) O-methyltransferase